MQRDQSHPPAFVEIRVLLFQPDGNSVHVGARLLDRHTGFEQTDGTHEAALAHPRIRPEDEGRPKLRTPFDKGILFDKEIEAFRHHPNNCLREAIKSESFAHDAAIATKTPLPETVAQYHHII